VGNLMPSSEEIAGEPYLHGNQQKQNTVGDKTFDGPGRVKLMFVACREKHEGPKAERWLCAKWRTSASMCAMMAL
jgi:hypothetical protein